MRLRAVRIALQVFFFSAFVASFVLLNRTPTAYSWPSEWFLRLNPLVALVVCVATRTLVWSVLAYGLAVAALTVVFGRFFCGMICPLGAIVDFSDRFLVGQTWAHHRRPPQYLQRLKYVLLVALGVCAVFGVVMPLFMDPISLLTRISTIVALPIANITAQDSLRALRWMQIPGFELISVKPLYFYGTVSALMLFGLVLAGGSVDKRFWCQYVCPSGALFGLLSRYALFRRRVSPETCNSCKLCARRCPTHAIHGERVQNTDVAECVVCGVCSEVRRVGCSSFGFGTLSVAQTTGANVNRRHVLGGVLGGLLVLPSLRADGLLKRDNTGRFIRPPGAIPEKEFTARCIACGQCMKVCPTNAIQPAALSDGLARWNSPKIVPRIGACEEKCSACGHVCPTGALRALPYEEKRFDKIGTAVIDRHRCLPWAQNKECLVCDESCPYNAIETKLVETTKGPYKAPVVYEDLCMGCGYCEFHCPINDKAAIEVFRFGENRIASGPYVSDWQKQKMEERRRQSDSKGMFEKTGTPPPQEAPPGFLPESGEPTAPKPAGNSDLPAGFVE